MGATVSIPQAKPVRASAGGNKRIVSVRAAATTAAPKRETDPEKRVVITGMGVCSCFGNDVDTFYDNLLDGVSGVTTIDKFDVSTYPTKFAAQIKNFSSDGLIDPKSDRRLDDYLRYTLVSGKKALRQAGLEGEGLNNVSMMYAYCILSFHHCMSDVESAT